MTVPLVDDGDMRLYVGDAEEVLRGLPDEAVHCAVTSPPYWGLRDYGVEGQLGLEPTPEEYVAAMVAVFREVRRVMRSDGTLWLNIGDSYASQGGPQVAQTKQHAGSGLHGPNRRRLSEQEQGREGDRDRSVDGNVADPSSGSPSSQETSRSPSCSESLRPKDLVGIPWRLAFALQADGWYLRSDIIWSKPNPMPESVTDRPTKAHEYVFLLTRSPRYFFDQEAVREKWADDRCGQPYPGVTGVSYNPPGQTPHSLARGPDGRRKTGVRGADGSLQHRDGERWPNGGRNVRSVWEIATQPYSQAHFATFPEELVRRMILAGTSEKGCCPECGAPWERETDVAYVKSPVHGAGSVVGRHETTGANNYDGAGMPRLNKTTMTTGWRPTCKCVYTAKIIRRPNGDNAVQAPLDPVPCTVLDPFGGSGTSALVARKHGRRSILIELSEEYARMAADRLSQLSLLAETS